MKLRSERPWCVEHDRSAEFTAVFPTQRTVCWVGLAVGGEAKPCRVETAIVEVAVTR